MSHWEWSESASIGIPTPTCIELKLIMWASEKCARPLRSHSNAQTHTNRHTARKKYKGHWEVSWRRLWRPNAANCMSAYSSWTGDLTIEKLCECLSRSPKSHTLAFEHKSRNNYSGYGKDMRIARTLACKSAHASKCVALVSVDLWKRTRFHLVEMIETA